MGQTEKNSVRAYVFGFTLSTGRCSAQSALRIWAICGVMHCTKIGRSMISFAAAAAR